MALSEFPKEYFIELPGQDYLLARLTLHRMNHDFMVEMDIIMRESGKIWAHVGSLYKLQEEDEAVDRGVQKIADYIKSKKV